MVASGQLEDLRRRAQESVTAEEAIELNARIVALDPNDAAALNRLGRAHQFLGYDEEAIETFERAVATDSPDMLAKTIARDRLRTLRGARRSGGRRGGTPAAVSPRDPEQALAVFDAQTRPGCVRLLADLLRFHAVLIASGQSCVTSLPTTTSTLRAGRTQPPDRGTG